jgi:hypothetical protein
VIGRTREASIDVDVAFSMLAMSPTIFLAKAVKLSQTSIRSTTKMSWFTFREASKLLDTFSLLPSTLPYNPNI